MGASPGSEGLDDASALADTLRPLLHRLLRLLRRESGDLGVSPLQSLLLVTIIERPGIGVSELARLEKLRGPTVSGHIKAMEEAGLVSRSVPNPDDRRRIGLIATKEGHGLIQAMKRRRTDWLAQQLTRLSPQAQRAIRNAIGPLNEIGR
jgi:DNA-binding MarR family transcriptional regulator